MVDLYKTVVQDNNGNDIIIQSDNYQEYLSLLQKITKTLEEGEETNSTLLLLEQL